MQYIIKETERGFLFKKGQFERMLEPGIHRVFGRSECRILPLNEPLTDAFDEAMLTRLLKDETFRRSVDVCEVGNAQLALHERDGRFVNALETGRHIFWKEAGAHRFTHYDLDTPEVPDTLPRHICDALCDDDWMTAYRIPEHAKGMLLFDGRLARVLEPGVYYFWSGGVDVDCELADTRLQQLTITGQEILTKDKVSVRLNFVCSYRITDFVSMYKEIRDYAGQFHIAAQMAARECVAVRTLDELLSDREVIAAEILAQLQKKAQAMYLDVTEAGIRDIILPGEVRDIMNTVLIAEKRAQANVITRREEVASTRSLLNTARMMEENKTLYKLKELEYLERICENVGNLSVGGGDLLVQLREILGVRG